MSDRMYGGIDLGGTKIEAALFDSGLNRVASQRTETPRQSYDALLDALAAQYEWLCTQAGKPSLPVGFGLPGVIDAATGLSRASNLVANGKPLRADLSQRLGFPVPAQNDCKCFALSEANGGAGEGYETVFGLILGTGCGGGVCRGGTLVTGSTGLPGEVGHLGVSARLAQTAELPLRRCACGREGCYETLVSGPGMTFLAQTCSSRVLSPQDIAEGARAGDASLEKVLGTWSDIACELIQVIEATVDPDCIVLGGGVSRIGGIAELLTTRLRSGRSSHSHVPVITVARHGDASGVRGAAMLAVQALDLNR